MNMPAKRLGNGGFTLLELLIATVIFSIILLATTTIVLQIGKMYYKGVVVNRTQETARRITDEISQQLQFGAESFVTGEQTYDTSPNSLLVKSFCIGSQRYSYAPNAKVTGSASADQYNVAGHELKHGLWRDTIVAGGNCVPLDLSQDSPSDANTVGGGQELLGQNMRVTNSFSVDCPSGSSLCTVRVEVVYGDDDLLVWSNPVRCGNVIGSQWCATATISAQVFKRLQQAGS